MRKLLKIASEVNPDYDCDFAAEMMERFELDGKKKFNHLSLGMKTMVSTIICLASSKDVVLLDEPVLGFDAIMRVEFYDMLTESFKKHPRIIIVSTHIIEEIAKTIEKLIIIDKGSIRFFDTLQSVEAKAFSVSGLQRDVEAATRGLNVIGQSTVGGLETCCIFDAPRRRARLSRSVRCLCRTSSSKWSATREVRGYDGGIRDNKAPAREQQDKLHRHGFGGGLRHLLRRDGA